MSGSVYDVLQWMCKEEYMNYSF